MYLDFTAGVLSKERLEWVTLFGGALYGTWKYGVKPVKQRILSFRESWSMIATKVARVDAMSQSLQRIEDELRPNGGGSLRDLVARIDRRLSTVEVDARLQREMQRAIASSPANAGLLEMNSAGECVWASSEWLRLAKVTLHDVIGWGWVNALHQYDRERVLSEWPTAVEQKRVYTDTLRLCRLMCNPPRDFCDAESQGPRGCATVRYTATPVFGDGHSIIGYVAVAIPQ